MLLRLFDILSISRVMARPRRFPIVYSSVLVSSGMRSTNLGIVCFRDSIMPLGCGRPHRIWILPWMEGMCGNGIVDCSERAAFGSMVGWDPRVLVLLPVVVVDNLKVWIEMRQDVWNRHRHYTGLTNEHFDGIWCPVMVRFFGALALLDGKA